MDEERRKLYKYFSYFRKKKKIKMKPNWMEDFNVSDHFDKLTKANLIFKA
jgi:hypothetical protein